MRKRSDIYIEIEIFFCRFFLTEKKKQTTCTSAEVDILLNK